MWSHLAGDGVSVALLKLYLLLARAPGVCISRSGKGPGGCVLQCQSGTKPDATEGEVVDWNKALSLRYSHNHDTSVWSSKAIVRSWKWDATNNSGNTLWSYSRILIQHITMGREAVETSPLTKWNTWMRAVEEVINSHTVDTGRKWSQASLLLSSKHERNCISDGFQISMSLWYCYGSMALQTNDFPQALVSCFKKRIPILLGL